MLIAVEQGESATTVVGFAAAGPADEQALAPEEPPLPDDVAAVTDLLVEPRWGRRGHGSRLLAAAVDLWREDGFTHAVAWAYEADDGDAEVPRPRPAGSRTGPAGRWTSTTCWSPSCACTSLSAEPSRRRGGGERGI